MSTAKRAPEYLIPQAGGTVLEYAAATVAAERDTYATYPRPAQRAVGVVTKGAPKGGMVEVAVGAVCPKPSPGQVWRYRHGSGISEFTVTSGRCEHGFVMMAEGGTAVNFFIHDDDDVRRGRNWEFVRGPAHAVDNASREVAMASVSAAKARDDEAAALRREREHPPLGVIPAVWAAYLAHRSEAPDGRPVVLTAISIAALRAHVEEGREAIPGRILAGASAGYDNGGSSRYGR